MKTIHVYGICGGNNDAFASKTIPKLIKKGILIPMLAKVTEKELARSLKIAESFLKKETK